ncbi:unnamed protein product [Brassica oleracea var. botrytis]|uniref:Uncharacterized protein n=1 Tax=Brassica oleracea TaxID=3712 RepID=A0A3P6ABY6_BRAOL|nr:unnamed protein product [Brassica oleracea]
MVKGCEHTYWYTILESYLGFFEMITSDWVLCSTIWNFMCL